MVNNSKYKPFIESSGCVLTICSGRHCHWHTIPSIPTRFFHTTWLGTIGLVGSPPIFSYPVADVQYCGRRLVRVGSKWSGWLSWGECILTSSRSHSCCWHNPGLRVMYERRFHCSYKCKLFLNGSHWVEYNILIISPWDVWICVDGSWDTVQWSYRDGEGKTSWVNCWTR